MKHESHGQVLNRLKRAHGHLHKVMDMMASDRPCVEIAQQLHAVEKAVASAKRTLIHDHIDHCLENSSNGGEGDSKTAIAEFKEITKYL